MCLNRKSTESDLRVGQGMKENLWAMRNMNCESVHTSRCGSELIMNRGPSENWAMKHGNNVHNHPKKPTKRPFRTPKVYKNPL